MRFDGQTGQALPRKGKGEPTDSTHASPPPRAGEGVGGEVTPGLGGPNACEDPLGFTNSKGPAIGRRHDSNTETATTAPFSGTNLTWGEALRLLSLLCGPPWLFGAIIILTGLVGPPRTALEWVLYAAAGPAAWGAFISAVADGRTLLGRRREPGTPRRSWPVEVRAHPTDVQQVIHGDQIRAEVVATHGGVVNQGDGVASNGDYNTIINAPVIGNVEVRHGDTYELPPGPQPTRPRCARRT